MQLKRKAKFADRDWVDHQACSLLQYINVIANLFIMGKSCFMYLHLIIFDSTKSLSCLSTCPSVKVLILSSRYHEKFSSKAEYNRNISLSTWRYKEKSVHVLIEYYHPGTTKNSHPKQSIIETSLCLHGAIKKRVYMYS